MRIGVLVDRGRAYGRRLCEGVAAYATARGGWELTTLDYDAFETRGFDAFIARVLDRRIMKKLKAVGKPVVDVYCALPCADFLHVDGDQVEEGRQAARYFIEHRFENFAFCGYDGVAFSDKRKRGFAEELARHDRTCDCYRSPASVRENFNATVLKNEQLSLGPDVREMSAWLRAVRKPAAVLCAHDLRAYQLAQICRERKIDVPRDVAILGCDDDALVCAFASVAISSSDPNAFEIGRLAAEKLDGLLARRTAGKCSGETFLVPPAGIVERRSTEVYPVNPPWLSDALVYIRRHVTDNITASDVYAHLKLSHTPVDTAFRKTLGSSVQKEIIRCRLDEACRLLRQDDLPVGVVAKRSGFSSGEYFFHSFADKFGMSPTEYRVRARDSRSSYRKGEDA